MLISDYVAQNVFSHKFSHQIFSLAHLFLKVTTVNISLANTAATLAARLQ